MDYIRIKILYVCIFGITIGRGIFVGVQKGKCKKTLAMNFDMCYPKKKLIAKSAESWNKNELY